MHYIAFLLLWLPQEDPTVTPKAAFIQKFATYKECKEFQSRVRDPDVKRQTACLLVVVEPKEGIAE